jgi:hypothetical protein
MGWLWLYKKKWGLWVVYLVLIMGFCWLVFGKVRLDYEVCECEVRLVVNNFFVHANINVKNPRKPQGAQYIKGA